VSVIIGLAVTHLVLGLVGLIQTRGETKIYWVHLAWVAFVMLWVIEFWWFFFAWQGLAEWSIDQFRLFLAYALTLSVAAGLLFPVRGTVPDYKAFFFEHTRWFFALLVLNNALDVVEVYRKAEVGIRSVPTYYLHSTVVITSVFCIAMLTKNERFHASAAIFALLWSLGYTAAVFG
jgi:hypothetical protein